MLALWLWGTLGMSVVIVVLAVLECCGVRIVCDLQSQGPATRYPRLGVSQDLGLREGLLAPTLTDGKHPSSDDSGGISLPVVSQDGLLRSGLVVDRSSPESASDTIVERADLSPADVSIQHDMLGVQTPKQGSETVRAGSTTRLRGSHSPRRQSGTKDDGSADLPIRPGFRRPVGMRGGSAVLLSSEDQGNQGREAVQGSHESSLGGGSASGGLNRPEDSVDAPPLVDPVQSMNWYSLERAGVAGSSEQSPRQGAHDDGPSAAELTIDPSGVSVSAYRCMVLLSTWRFLSYAMLAGALASARLGTSGLALGICIVIAMLVKGAMLWRYYVSKNGALSGSGGRGQNRGSIVAVDRLATQIRTSPQPQVLPTSNTASIQGNKALVPSTSAHRLRQDSSIVDSRIRESDSVLLSKQVAELGRDSFVGEVPEWSESKRFDG